MDTIVTDNIKIQDSIFTEFSWLEELVNISDCEGTSIHVFDKGAFSYLIIESAQNVEMYFEDGQFYCQDSQDFSCQSAYKLAEPTYTWSCESEDESQINIDVKSLAIQNQSPKDELSVFPNPSFGDFEVNLPTDFSEGQLSLFSMNGKLIYKQDIMSTRELNTVSIDLYKEAPGMYILQLVSEDQRYSKKVILK